MKGLQGTAESRAQLHEWMDESRKRLRVSWADIARDMDMTEENLLRIRRGRISISLKAARKIEDALQWESGSVEAAVLHGRRPVAAPAFELPVAPSATDAIPPDWSEEEEQRWLVARETLEALKLRANLTRAEWRGMRAKYDRWDAADQAQKANVTPGDRS